MNPTPQVPPEQFVESMKEEIEQYVEEVMETVNQAAGGPDSSAIGVPQAQEGFRTV